MLVAVRLTDEYIRQLDQILQKLGIEPITQSKDRSATLRKFIDTLYVHFGLVKSNE